MKSLNTREIILITLGGTVLNLFWVGWTLLDDVSRPILKPLGLSNTLQGVWLLGLVIFPYIIRKPGSAFLGELLPSLIESFSTHYGFFSLYWGLVQGLAAEVIFLLFHYRSWGIIPFALAVLFADFSGHLLTIFVYSEHHYSLNYLIFSFTVSAVSSFIFATLFGRFIVNTLYKTGLLNQFKIAQSSS